MAFVVAFGKGGRDQRPDRALGLTIRDLPIKATVLAFITEDLPGVFVCDASLEWRPVLSPFSRNAFAETGTRQRRATCSASMMVVRFAFAELVETTVLLRLSQWDWKDPPWWTHLVGLRFPRERMRQRSV